MLILPDKPCVWFCECVGGVWFRQLVRILTLVLIRLGRQIGLGSKRPILLALVLSICHSQNYGVKNKETHGRGNILSLYLQGKDTSRCSLSTVYTSTVLLHSIKPNIMGHIWSRNDDITSVFEADIQLRPLLTTKLFI